MVQGGGRRTGGGADGHLETGDDGGDGHCGGGGGGERAPGARDGEGSSRLRASSSGRQPRHVDEGRR